MSEEKENKKNKISSYKSNIMKLEWKIRLMRSSLFIIVLLIFTVESQLNLISNVFSKDFFYFIILMFVFIYGMIRYEKEYTNEWLIKINQNKKIIKDLNNK